jgi:peptide chain release factor 3
VVDRRDGRFHRFARTPGGATIAPGESVSAGQARSEEGDAWTTAEEELALLDAVGARFDVAPFRRGAMTPVFFGSALSNFGVGLLLHALAKLAPPPGPRPAADGEPRGLSAPFSGLVFKVQANLDRRHRDRLLRARLLGPLPPAACGSSTPAATGPSPPTTRTRCSAKSATRSSRPSPATWSG